MGEQPTFVCLAHVFTIDPYTKKDWVANSSGAVEVSFYFDPLKSCYRIISLNEGYAGKKVIINSYITDRMNFKKTSQKFGQWTDNRAGQVYGLGFSDEDELTKFMDHFMEAVEVAKNSVSLRSNTNIGGSSFNSTNLSTAPNHNDLPVNNFYDSGSTDVANRTHSVTVTTSSLRSVPAKIPPTINYIAGSVPMSQEQRQNKTDIPALQSEVMQMRLGSDGVRSPISSRPLEKECAYLRQEVQFLKNQLMEMHNAFVISQKQTQALMDTQRKIEHLFAKIYPDASSSVANNTNNNLYVNTKSSPSFRN